MAGRRTGGTTPDGSQAGDTNSSEQIDSMRSEISSLTQQMGQLVQLVGGLAARIEEKSGGATEGAAESGGAVESVATSTAGHFGTVQYDGSAQAADLRRESGPSGRHSGEVGGSDPQEVRVAAAHNQACFRSAMGSGAAVFGSASVGYQSVKYTAPTFSGDAKSFSSWLEYFLMATNTANLLELFEEGGAEIPVNSGQSKVQLSRFYPHDKVELAFHAWNFLRGALKDEKDRTIMKRAESPLGALRELKGLYDPESSMQPADELKSLTSKKIPMAENPQHALNSMLATAESLSKRGLDVNETFVLHLFLDALSNEYAMTKHALRHKERLTRSDVLKEVTIEYRSIMEKVKAGKGKGARGAEQAYLADGGGRRGRSSWRGGGRRGRSSWRGRGGGRSGGRGGGDSSGKGGGGVEESKGSGSGGADGGGTGDKKFPGRCFTCGRFGHTQQDCTTKESDYLPQCSHCAGWGHSKDKCATEEAVLAQIVHADSDADSVDNQAFCAAPGLPGECGAVDLGLVGVTELGQDVMVYVAGTAATCSMFRCANAFVNYRECSGWVKGIGGNKAPVPLLGYGDVTVVFLTEGGRVPVLILNAAHVPESPHNLLSLSALAEEGHTYSGQKGGLTLTTRAGGKVWFPRTGKLVTQEGYQIEPKVDIACAATIVPGDAKAATPTDLNYYHNSHGHTHEELLQKTAKQQGVQLTGGPLLPCLGCSMSKGQLLPLADDEEGGEDESKQSTSRQGAGGVKDSESESDSDLDVTEAGRATLPVQEKAPAAPGNGTGDAGSGVPLSPPSGGGDFDGSSSGSSGASPAAGA
ncbi:unnamed protein product [Ectocarpus sp. CCAP 1310/34]|nr:unnamed protein product [Ectocarpus sp. CCAP 1310/34]